MMNYSTISACRLCGSDRLEDLFSLGEQYVNDFPKEWPPKTIKCPIDIVECKNCSLVQNKHSAPNDLLYSKHYWYKSGINQVIIDDLKEIAEVAMTYMEKGNAILDIGANDGTMLSFVDKKFNRIGIEPADNLQDELKKHCDETIHDFWEGYPNKVKVITAIGMFYDLEDPVKFVSDAQKCLSDDGVFIAQLMTAKQMYENSDMGNLCHEHLEFYNYKSLVYLFEKSGLEIFKVEENSINGGSYRIFARHLDKGSIQVEEEKIDWGIFARNLLDSKRMVRMYIQNAKNSGGKIYAYGASTKGNVILQYYGLTDWYISGVADKDPEKWGKKTLTGIPIVSEEEARKEATHFLILPYAFTDMFVKREKEWLKGGGKFIVPLPFFKIIE